MGTQNGTNSQEPQNRRRLEPGHDRHDARRGEKKDQRIPSWPFKGVLEVQNAGAH